MVVWKICEYYRRRVIDVNGLRRFLHSAFYSCVYI
uniref:2-hydroxyacyl-CoA lyase 2 n=1 Tax=Parascaris univalens TaxID=6257 RepID=A0A915BLH5_PARUN